MDDAPKFKLRSKSGGPPGSVPAAPEPLAPPPEIGDVAPPPPPAGIALSVPGSVPAPSMPTRIPVSLPPMSVIAAPPPPDPGAVPEAPAPPGSVPRLSLATPHEKPAGPKGLQIKVAEGPKVGGKPVVVKPGKTAPVLRKRPALGILAKAGIAFLVIAVAIGGIFSYRIFFPAPSPVVAIKAPPIAKPVVLQPAPKVAAEPGKDVGTNTAASPSTGNQAKGNTVASGQQAAVPTPVPTPDKSTTESVMTQSNIASDVKVNNTHIDTSPAASAEFRLFVANAEIGGVFQGTPPRALINGRIVKASQPVDNQLGIIFDRIDSEKKVIYFKDATGAEVSKEY